MSDPESPQILSYRDGHDDLPKGKRATAGEMVVAGLGILGYLLLDLLSGSIVAGLLLASLQLMEWFLAFIALWPGAIFLLCLWRTWAAIKVFVDHAKSRRRDR